MQVFQISQRYFDKFRQREERQTDVLGYCPYCERRVDYCDCDRKEEEEAMKRSQKCYELVDVSCDEVYWTLGVFHTLAGATIAVSDHTKKHGEPPHDDRHDHTGEHIFLKIMERNFGMGGEGVKVWSKEWTERYYENTDEYIYEEV